MAKNVTTANQIQKLREELRRHEYRHDAEPTIPDFRY